LTSFISKADYLDGHSIIYRSLLTSKNSFPKTLQFHRYDEVFEIPHLNDFSDEEVDATWHSKHKYEEIRLSCLRTVQLVEQKIQKQLQMDDESSWEYASDSDDGNDQDRSTIDIESCYCSRGLEKHCSKDRASRKSQKELSYQVVWAVVRLAQQKGMTLTAMMSQMYGKSCSKAVLEARLLPLKDEQDVSQHEV
jgi:hypothetical protein